LLGQNFMEEFRDDLLPYLVVIFALVAAASVGYAIFLGLQLAKAEDEGKRKQAKKRIMSTLAGLFIVVILFTTLMVWDPGDVHSRETAVYRNVDSYHLTLGGAYAYQADGRYPVELTFMGNSIDEDKAVITWGTPVLRGGGTASARFEFDDDGGRYFVRASSSPPPAVEIWDFEVTVVILIDGKQEEIKIPKTIHIYDGTRHTPPVVPLPPPVIDPPPPPVAVPPDQSHLPPTHDPVIQDPQDPGNKSNPPNPVSTQPAQGNYKFVPVVPLPKGKKMHAMVTSPRWISNSQKDPNCTPCKNTSSTRNRTHNGVDIGTRNIEGFANNAIPIFTMQSGIVVKALGTHRDNTVGACNASVASSSCGGCTSGTGNTVIIRHADSSGNPIMIDGKHVYSRYLHLAPANGCAALSGLREGSFIKPGTRIGTMGTTGHSTGIHLHWDLFLSSTRINSGNLPSSGTYVCPASYYP